MESINPNDFVSILELIKKYPETKLLKWNKKNIKSILTGLIPFREDEKGVMFVPEKIFLDLKAIAESNLNRRIKSKKMTLIQTH